MTKVALFDMDSSLVDWDASIRAKLQEMMSPMEAEWFAMHQHGLLDDAPTWLKARERAIKKQPGFWFELPVIEFGMELYRWLGDELGYRRMILTRGPHNNPTAWAEKVQWCEAHVPEALVTITLDKSFVNGDVLYDDWPPYLADWLKDRPNGKGLMLDAPFNRDFQHPQVFRCMRGALASQREAILEFLGE